MKKIRELKTFTGTVQATERGFAFIIPDDKDKYREDFFVPRASLGGAYDGDKVLATHVRGTADEAEIIKVLERKNTFVVGTFKKSGKYACVYPDNVKLPKIVIPLTLSAHARSGDKVMCNITSYPQRSAPRGKVTEILGESGDFDAEELSIIRSFGLSEQFPYEVMQEAETSADRRIVPDSLLDLRGELIFTVDGENTRDIDDAVSLEVEGDNFILGVHIADVSRYVKLKSELDREAYSRGTSVYFPDRVLPMLPGALSNGACSLNEGEDRYALSCFMTFDKSGNRLKYKIAESIINSRHKMTYSEVTAICNGDGQICEKYSDIRQTVENMQKLCLILENRRSEAGGVNLSVEDAEIYVDGEGEIVIKKDERGISERIIEQFMIAANEAVANFLIKKNSPCLFRIHEPPSPEKADSLKNFLHSLGMSCALRSEFVSPMDYKKILDSVKGMPVEGIVNSVMLRSMQKARYDAANAGHFGLASTSYCHFTSPIRRYPDLFVHRCVKAVLYEDKKLSARYSHLAKFAGAECSEKERIADEAERAVDALYKLAYMSEHIGEAFEVTVSHITDFGIFCTTDNCIEGMIDIESLPPDRYEFYPEKYMLKGVKRTFRLGDRIKVLVDGCDLGRMRVMFSLY